MSLLARHFRSGNVKKETCFTTAQRQRELHVGGMNDHPWLAPCGKPSNTTSKPRSKGSLILMKLHSLMKTKALFVEATSCDIRYSPRILFTRFLNQEQSCHNIVFPCPDLQSQFQGQKPHHSNAARHLITC